MRQKGEEMKADKCDLCHRTVEAEEIRDLYCKHGKYTLDSPIGHRGDCILPAYRICKACAAKYYENGTIE